jgi:hypothetical protein
MWNSEQTYFPLVLKIQMNGKGRFGADLWIGCGKYEEYKDGYLLIIEPKKAIIKRWFKPNIDLTQQLGQLTDALKQILEAEPLIHDIKWWTAEEFEK